MPSASFFESFDFGPTPPAALARQDQAAASGDGCQILPGMRVRVLPGRQFRDFGGGDAGVVVNMDREAGICDVAFDGRGGALPVATRHLEPSTAVSSSTDVLRIQRSDGDNFTGCGALMESSVSSGKMSLQQFGQNQEHHHGGLAMAAQAAAVLAESIVENPGVVSDSRGAFRSQQQVVSPQQQKGGVEQGRLAMAAQAAAIFAESVAENHGANSEPRSAASYAVPHEPDALAEAVQASASATASVTASAVVEVLSMRNQVSSIRSAIGDLRELVMRESDQRIASCQRLEHRLGICQSEFEIRCRSETERNSKKDADVLALVNSLQCLKEKLEVTGSSADHRCEGLEENLRSLDERISTHVRRHGENSEAVQVRMEELRHEFNRNDRIIRLDERMGLIDERLKALAQIQSQATEEAQRQFMNLERGNAVHSERAAQIDDVSHQHAGLRTELAALAASQAELSRRSVSEERVQHLQTQLDGSRSELAALASSQAELGRRSVSEERLGFLQTQIDGVLRSLAALAQAPPDPRIDRLDQSALELAQMRPRIDQLEQALKDAAKTYVCKDLMEQSRTDLNTLQSRCNQLEQEIKEFGRAHPQLERLEQSHAELTKHQPRIEQLEQEIKILAKSHQDFCSSPPDPRIDKLEQAHNQLFRTHVDQARAIIDPRIDQLERTHKPILDKLHGGHAELSSRVEGLTYSHVEFEKSSNARVESMQLAVFAKIDAMQAELSTKIIELVQEQAKTKTDVDRLRGGLCDAATVASYGHEVDSAARKISSLSERLDRLHNEVVSGKVCAAEAQSQHTRTADELSNRFDEISRSHAELLGVHGEMARLSQVDSRLARLRDDLEGEIAQRNLSQQQQQQQQQSTMTALMNSNLSALRKEVQAELMRVEEQLKRDSSAQMVAITAAVTDSHGGHVSGRAIAAADSERRLDALERSMSELRSGRRLEALESSASERRDTVMIELERRVDALERASSDGYSRVERQAGEAVRVGQRASEALEAHCEAARQRELMQEALQKRIEALVQGLAAESKHREESIAELSSKLQTLSNDVSNAGLVVAQSMAGKPAGVEENAFQETFSALRTEVREANALTESRLRAEAQKRKESETLLHSVRNEVDYIRNELKRQASRSITSPSNSLIPPKLLLDESISSTKTSMEPIAQTVQPAVLRQRTVSPTARSPPVPITSAATTPRINFVNTQVSGSSFTNVGQMVEQPWVSSGTLPAAAVGGSPPALQALPMPAPPRKVQSEAANMATSANFNMSNADRCVCGNIFASDAVFCRKCGLKRADHAVHNAGYAFTPTSLLTPPQPLAVLGLDLNRDDSASSKSFAISTQPPSQTYSPSVAGSFGAWQNSGALPGGCCADNNGVGAAYSNVSTSQDGIMKTSAIRAQSPRVGGYAAVPPLNGRIGVPIELEVVGMSPRGTSTKT